MILYIFPRSSRFSNGFKKRISSILFQARSITSTFKISLESSLKLSQVLFHLDMPGHVVKSTGPDPDPSPWLIVGEALKKKRDAKPYDAKKSCWIPDKASGGYLEALIESTDGAKVTVKVLETGDVSQEFNDF